MLTDAQVGDLLYGAPTLTGKLKAAGRGEYAATNKHIELGLVLSKNTIDADQPLTIVWRLPGGTECQPEEPLTHETTKGPSKSSVCRAPTLPGRAPCPAPHLQQLAPAHLLHACVPRALIPC